jgi:hypothetical protein
VSDYNIWITCVIGAAFLMQRLRVSICDKEAAFSCSLVVMLSRQLSALFEEVQFGGAGSGEERKGALERKLTLR